MLNKPRQQAGDMGPAAKETEFLSEALIDCICDVVGISDMAGRISRINTAVEAWGYKKEELLGKSVAEVLARRSLPDLLEAREKALKQGYVRNLELTGLKKDGSEFPVAVNVSLIRDGEGRPSGSAFTLRDITGFNLAIAERDARIQDLDFLSKVAMEIVELPLEKNIYKFAAEKLQQIAGDSIISVSSYNKSANSIHPQALLGLGKYADTVMKILGASPLTLSFNVPYPEKMEEMTTSKLNRIPDGLYGATFGQVPRAVCQTIEKLLNMDGAYGIGLRREKRLFGTVVIYTRCKTGLRQSIIETFVNQVAVILERNLANEKRLEAMKESAAIINGMPDPLMELDLDGTVLNVNPAYATVFGAKAAAVIGTHYDKLSDRKPGDTGRFRLFLEELAETGRAKDDEIVFNRSDGGKFPGIVNYSTIKDAKGAPKKIIAVIRDITGHKRVEEQLRESEARHKALFMGAAEGILAIDLETRRLSYVNPAACGMFKYTEEEMIKLSVMDIHPEESRARLTVEYEAHARNEKAMTPEIPCLRKDGTVFYAEIKTAPIVLDGRRCSVGFIQDVTERRRVGEKEKELVAAAAEAAAEKKKAAEIRQAQDLLQQERAILNSIIESNPYGIQIFDAEGRHVRANQAFLKMFQAVPPADYCIYDDPIIAKAGFHEARQTIKKGGTHVLPEAWYNAHWRYPEMPDNLRCFRTTVFPIMTAGGEMKSFVVMFEDITERKRAEERLERFNSAAVNQELEMVRLEEEVNTLLIKSGQPVKYETPEKIRKSESK